MKNFIYTVISIALFILLFNAQANASREKNSIEFSYSSLSASGNYKKYFSELNEEYGGMDLSNKAYGISFWFPFSERAEMGLSFSSFGNNVAEGKKSGNYEQEKDGILSTAAGLKLHLIGIKISEKSRFQIYAKAGGGIYRRNYAFDVTDGYYRYTGKKSQYSPGYNAAIGANIVFDSNYNLGIEYRFDRMAEKTSIANSALNYHIAAFEAASLSINLGYRFSDFSFLSAENDAKQTYGSNEIKTEGNRNSSLARQKTAPKEINTAAEQEQDTQNMAPKAKTYAEMPLKAVNPEPGQQITQLDKEKYLAQTAKIKQNLPKSGKLEIPSMGVLFKIGQSKLLSYYHEMLDEFIFLYDKTDRKAKIIIEAYSSNAKNESNENPNISRQRAQSVADYLIEKGISKEMIEIKAYSNSKIRSKMFASDESCKAGQCYRRANISIK